MDSIDTLHEDNKNRTTKVVEVTTPFSFHAPWLLSVMVAVSMIIFLLVSFYTHHKRALLKKRKSCQYYTAHYHRVPGPMALTPSPLENEASGACRGQIDNVKAREPESSPSRMIDRLRRCHSLSPRHLIPTAKRDNVMSVDGIAGRSRDQRLAARAPWLEEHCDKGYGCSHPDHIAVLRVSSGKAESRPKTSRVVVVTTVSGSLARANLAGNELLLSTYESLTSNGLQELMDLPFIDDESQIEFFAGSRM